MPALARNLLLMSPKRADKERISMKYAKYFYGFAVLSFLINTNISNAEETYLDIRNADGSLRNFKELLDRVGEKTTASMVKFSVDDLEANRTNEKNLRNGINQIYEPISLALGRKDLVTQEARDRACENYGMNSV